MFFFFFFFSFLVIGFLFFFVQLFLSLNSVQSMNDFINFSQIIVPTTSFYYFKFVIILFIYLFYFIFILFYIGYIFQNLFTQFNVCKQNKATNGQFLISLNFLSFDRNLVIQNSILTRISVLTHYLRLNLHLDDHMPSTIV